MPSEDAPSEIHFTGSETAELFTHEVAESFAGVLARNLINRPDDPMRGFVSASIDGRPWTGTMWTRDAGVFLRELVLWGRIETACLVAERLIDLVRKNSEGYRTFPTYFLPNQPASGSELDGTSAILVACWLLYDRLDPHHPTAGKIARFFSALDSPIEYILKRLESHPLVPGSGEFGGGLGIEGEYYNVIQNHMVGLALASAQRLFHATGYREQAYLCEQAAQKLEQGLRQYLRGDDGGWIWAVDVSTMSPNREILDELFNKGFGGLNGTLSMPCDVYGMDTHTRPGTLSDPGEITFDRLFADLKRRTLFKKYGVWTQFDTLYDGYFTSPSYGHCYALQAMLLLDRMNMAGKAVDFLARVTYEPFPGNILDRDSRYYFYERIYLPELSQAWQEPSGRRKNSEPDWIVNAFDGQNFDQGCGALNLVNVAEPLKIARLVAGIHNPDSQEFKLIPRLPKGWDGLDVKNWPIATTKGIHSLNYSVRRESNEPSFMVRMDFTQSGSRVGVRAGPFPPELDRLSVTIDGRTMNIPTFRSGDSSWGWVDAPPITEIKVMPA